jgi:hypothetical protein
MSLLSDLMTDTLDAGYADAAARRGGPRTPRPGAGLVAGVVLVGFLFTVAVLDVRDRALGAGSGRQALVDEVVRRTEAADRSAAELVRLRGEITRPAGTRWHSAAVPRSPIWTHWSSRPARCRSRVRAWW